MKHTLSIDQSTSATKAMLFDQDVKLIKRVSTEHTQYYPQPGWVEHDPMEILDNTYKTVQLLIEQTGIEPEQISSVSITNQRETVVVWDKRTGKPVYNAIVWQCNRGTKICEQLKSEGYEPMVQEMTGLLIDPYFSASGVHWILKNVKGARKAAEEGNLLLGTMDSWLIWNFTSGKTHATDYTNACRTLLLNINYMVWDDELLRLFSIPRSMLPDLLPCDSLFGHTTLNNLLPKVPIAGVMGDSHGALFGQMCFTEGMGKATYGTGSSIMINIGKNPFFPPKGLVTSIGFALKGDVYYAYEGNIHYTGATIKWLIDELKLIENSTETEEFALSVEDNGGVYFVPAFTGLGAPWWDSEARALICGLSRGTTKAHLVRASLESIAYQIKDLLNLIINSGVSLSELRVDGGPVKNNFLMQFQSDILNIKINRSPVEEASALGALFMNGFALGKWDNLEQISALRKKNDYIEPQMPAQKIKKLYSGWEKAIKRTMMK